MGFYDNIASSAFKDMPDGKCIYYPNGVLSKGRVIPNDKVKKQLYNYQKWSVKYGIPIGAIFGVFIGVNHGPFSLLLVFIIPLLWQKYLIKNLLVHNSKITAKEAFKKSQIPAWYLKTLKVLSIFLTLLGILFLLLLKGHFYFPMLLISMGVLSYSLASYISRINSQPEI